MADAHAHPIRPASPEAPFTPLFPGLSIAAQIDVEILERAARTGFRLVICNRPDGEEAAQPAAESLRRRAESLGIGFVHLPIRPGHFPDRDVAAFRAAVAGAGGCVLAYCRSGTRSASLAALARRDAFDLEASFRTAEEAGYDLSRVRAWLGKAGCAAPPLDGSGS